MNSRAFRAALAVPVIAVVSVGCSDDSPTEKSRDRSTTSERSTTLPATTAAPTTAAPTTAAPTTAPVATADFETPSEAGQALFDVWRSGDRARAGAEALAAPEQLDRLFATVVAPTAKNRGCDSGSFGSAGCFFINEPGGVNISLVPRGQRWIIETIEPFA